MLYAFGVGEVPISTSGDVGDGRHDARAHDPRGRRGHEGALRRAPGDVVGVRGPFGNRWPIDAARGHDLVVVGGGVGLPPLRPAIYHALAHRADFGKIVVLYGGRTPDDLLFRKELERWRGRLDVERRGLRRLGRAATGAATSASSRS